MLIFIKLLIAVIGVALLVPAPVALIAPGLAASAFGVPVTSDEAQAYLLATATRDVALGVWLLWLLILNAAPRILAASLWSIAVVAAGDALNVGIFTQWHSLELLVPHIGGAIVLLAVGWILWSRQPLECGR